MDTECEILHCYCGTTDQGSLKWNLQCIECKKLFHLECLKEGKPSNLEGDTFFAFTCCSCSETKIEKTVRINFQWTEVIRLALYNLQLKSSGKCGFFRWQEDICSFIDTNWKVLFESHRKKTPLWHGTVAGTLSAGATKGEKYFVNGYDTLKQQGLWKLANNEPPDRKDDYDEQGNRKVRTRAKRKLNNHPDELTKSCADNGSRKVGRRPKGKLTSNNLPDEFATSTNLKNIATITADERDLPSTSAKQDYPFSASSTASAGIPNFMDDGGYLLPEDDSVLSDLDVEDLDIDPGSVSPISVPSPPAKIQIPDIYDRICSPKHEKYSDNHSDSEDEEDYRNLGRIDKSPSGKMPVDAEKSSNPTEVGPQDSSSSQGNDDVQKDDEFCMVPLGIYEEKLLLNRLKKLENAVQTCVTAKRLKRKLLLRQWKRERGLTIFNLDDYLTNDQKSLKINVSCSSNNVARGPADQFFYRYQVGAVRNSEQSWTYSTFFTKLVCPGDSFSPIVSPYTNRVLKPYIWQDFVSKPLKLRLLEDITAHYAKKHEDYKPQPLAPINFCYVQPHHIPSVNALCKQFFWEGIDMSESLQYPDFSCIALYRKIVIGFAFMVPDVKYNEAYISFIFTHPEWRNVGVASFMLYHLIQTCMGKDVTLHVSATSPALFLYQKFGFKVEEFIVDFYDKYYFEENQECKDAVFLRLSR